MARRLLEARAGHAGDGAFYGPVLREVESLYEDRERVNLPDLPAAILRPVQEDLLFECSVPTVGDKAQLYVPLILARTAINAVNRLVDSVRVKIQ